MMNGYAPGWWVRCTQCGWTTAASEIGMTRVGAVSKRKRVRAKCAQCGKARWLSVMAGPTEDDLPPFGTPSSQSKDSTPGKFCSGLTLLITLGVALFVLSLFGGLQIYFSQHALVRQTMSVAIAHPVVKGELGAPIEIGWPIFGSIRNGTANLQVPVQGPQGKGSLLITGHVIDGTWQLDNCRLRVGKRSVGELLPPPPIDTASPAHQP